MKFSVLLFSMMMLCRYAFGGGGCLVIPPPSGSSLHSKTMLDTGSASYNGKFGAEISLADIPLLQLQQLYSALAHVASDVVAKLIVLSNLFLGDQKDYDCAKSEHPPILIDPDPEMRFPEVEDLLKIKKLTIRPVRSPYKYRFLEIKDSPLANRTAVARSLAREMIETDQSVTSFIFFRPPNHPLLIEDYASSNFTPMIREIINDDLFGRLVRLLKDGAEYMVIYDHMGQPVYLVKYKDGTVRQLTANDILRIYGEWFDKYIYQFLLAHFEQGYGPYIPVNPYTPGAAVIPEPAKKPNKKEDPSIGGQPVDGQGSSRTSPSGTPPIQKKPPASQAPTAEPDPSPSGGESLQLPKDTPSDFEAYSRLRDRDPGPSTRHSVAKAMTSMSRSGDVSEQGIKTLAKAIPKGKLTQKFGHFEDFPPRHREVQIRWLLKHGHIIPLSRFALSHARDAWKANPTTTSRLVKLQRTHSERITRTKVKSGESHSAQLDSVLVKALDGAIPAPDSHLLITADPTNGQKLETLIQKGWQVILTYRREAPVFHSAEHQQLLKDAGILGSDHITALATSDALEYLLWQPKEAQRITGLVRDLIPQNLEDNMRKTMESHEDKPGLLEKQLMLGRYIRHPEHPGVGKGGIRLGNVRKHIQISYREQSGFNGDVEAPHVLIEVSIEFSGFTMTTALGETHTFDLVLASKNQYRYQLHGASVEELKREIFLVTPPTIEILGAPDADQIEAALLAKAKQGTKGNLEKRRQFIDKAKAFLEKENPKTMAELVPLAKHLKNAQQWLNLNWQSAAEWQLSSSEIDALAAEISPMMDQYRALVNSIVRDNPPSAEDELSEVHQLFMDYRQLILEIQAVYEETLLISQSMNTVSAQDLKRLSELTDQSVDIGERMRNEGKPLSVRRIALVEAGKLTEKHGTILPDSSYVYVTFYSALTSLNAQIAYHVPRQESTDSEERRSRLFSESSAADPLSIQEPPLQEESDPTMPIMTEDNQEEFDEDNLFGEDQALSDDSSTDNSSPEEVND